MGTQGLEGRVEPTLGSKERRDSPSAPQVYSPQLTTTDGLEVQGRSRFAPVSSSHYPFTEVAPLAPRDCASQTAGMTAPETRYARSGDVHIAYQVIGDGPVDIVHVPA